MHPHLIMLMTITTTTTTRIWTQTRNLRFLLRSSSPPSRNKSSLSKLSSLGSHPSSNLTSSTSRHCTDSPNRCPQGCTCCCWCWKCQWNSYIIAVWCIDSDANQRILTTYQPVGTNNWRDDQSILIMGGYSPVRHHAKLELWTKSCKPLGDTMTPRTQATEPSFTCSNVTHSIWLESTSTNPSSWVMALGWKWGLASTKLWVVSREKKHVVATLWPKHDGNMYFLKKKSSSMQVVLLINITSIANLNWYLRNHLRCLRSSHRAAGSHPLMVSRMYISTSGAWWVEGQTTQYVWCIYVHLLPISTRNLVVCQQPFTDSMFIFRV